MIKKLISNIIIEFMLSIAFISLKTLKSWLGKVSFSGIHIIFYKTITYRNPEGKLQLDPALFIQ